MGFKQLFIQSKSYLNYKNNSLHIQNELNDTLVCLDDIDTIVVENQHCTLSATLLAKVAQKGINIIFVDEGYMPAAISVGLYKNSRVTKVQYAQISIKKPQHKRLWKSIIQAKVYHQALVLNTQKKDEYLFSLVNKVKSGDSESIESLAAAYYFKELFGREFTRQSESDMRNAALNYGYAVLRSSIARSLVAYGLNPLFGLWHANQLNAFNLADDFLEPFRPVVDLYVVKNVTKETNLTPELKRELAGLLYFRVQDSFAHTITLTNAIKNLVASYQSFCLQKRDDIDIFMME